MKGIVTCKVCGRDFMVHDQNHYVSRDVEESGVIPALKGHQEGMFYDTFDCPHCGCQYVAQERKHILWKNEETHECENCRHNDVAVREFPCAVCSHNFIDYWEKPIMTEEEEDE